MTINKTRTGSTLEVALIGKLDTVTSPALEKEMNGALTGISELYFDFSQLEYISSAGLRILLGLQKVMNRQGEMVIRNVNDTINDVFEITGFIDILTIE